MASNNQQKGETMTKTIKNTTWERCESEGFWWAKDGRSIRRSDRNQNIWILVSANEEVIDEFNSLTQAMRWA